MKIKLKDLISEATLDDLVGASSDPSGQGQAPPPGSPEATGEEDPRDVQKLVDKMMNNQAMQLAVKKINMKSEVGPAVIAFAKMLNDQVPGSLSGGRLQRVIAELRRALKGA